MQCRPRITEYYKELHSQCLLASEVLTIDWFGREAKRHWVISKVLTQICLILQHPTQPVIMLQPSICIVVKAIGRE